MVSLSGLTESDLRGMVGIEFLRVEVSDLSRDSGIGFCVWVLMETNVGMRKFRVACWGSERNGNVPSCGASCTDL